MQMKTNTKHLFSVIGVVLAMVGVSGCNSPQPAQTAPPAAAAGIDRTVLPIAEPDYPRETSSTRATPRRRRGSR